jgi:hypothetical protein
VIWLTLEALLAIVWNGNGSDFAYRYLIGSFAGALVIWLEVIPLASPLTRRMFQGLTWANGAWVVLMTMIYSSVPSTMVYWEAGMAGCYIPPDMSLKIFENLTNWNAYRIALVRQVVPLTLYLSRNPASVPGNTPFQALRGPEITILTWAMALSLAYVLFFLLSRMVVIIFDGYEGKARLRADRVRENLVKALPGDHGP